MASFILTCNEADEDAKDGHLYTHASWFSLLFNDWVTALVALGAKQPLYTTDEWNLSQEDTCASIFCTRSGQLPANATNHVSRFNMTLVRCFQLDLLLSLAFLALFAVTLNFYLVLNVEFSTLRQSFSVRPSSQPTLPVATPSTRPSSSPFSRSSTVAKRCTITRSRSLGKSISSMATT
ncbi:Aste57867_4393 [Aphanomyces stellatus]|uniref:Aste57867_4393 protein n=1 Tax=Aphanomyces stellatus TaxID=120398 RepID=A0A485KGK1_9STRA|nr:hypothetical protein As57867_004381 [Aphanomyces stellatus]VFT81505.1 Aste57867_4393 [Aphanomyces stellatus]